MKKTAANFAYAIMVKTAPVHVYAVQEDGERTLISTFTSAGQRVFLAQTARTEIVGDYDLFTGPLTTAALIGAGSDGADGLSAYELAVQQGFTGSLGEWLESLRGEVGPAGAAPSVEDVAAALLPYLAAEVAMEGPTASYNGQCNYFQLGSAYLAGDLVLKQLGYRVRFDSVDMAAAGPVYLGVWERSEDGTEWVKLGVSLDTQEHAGTLDMMWSFELGEVRLSGRPIRCCLLASREDDWREDLLMGLRTANTSDADTRIWYDGTQYTSVPKFFIRGYKMSEAFLVGGGGGSGFQLATSYDPADSTKAVTGRVLAAAIAEALANYTCTCGGNNTGGGNTNDGGGNTGGGNTGTGSSFGNGATDALDVYLFITRHKSYPVSNTSYYFISIVSITVYKNDFVYDNVECELTSNLFNYRRLSEVEDIQFSGEGTASDSGYRNTINIRLKDKATGITYVGSVIETYNGDADPTQALSTKAYAEL